MVSVKTLSTTLLDLRSEQWLTWVRERKVIDLGSEARLGSFILQSTVSPVASPLLSAFCLLVASTTNHQPSAYGKCFRSLRRIARLRNYVVVPILNVTPTHFDAPNHRSSTPPLAFLWSGSGSAWRADILNKHIVPATFPPVQSRNITARS